MHPSKIKEKNSFRGKTGFKGQLVHKSKTKSSKNKNRQHLESNNNDINRKVLKSATNLLFLQLLSNSLYFVSSDLVTK